MSSTEVLTTPSPETRAVPARRLRLAVFSYGLPQAGVKRGGIERVAHDLADGLAARGHRVTVFTYDAAPPGARYAVEPAPAGRFVRTWLGRRLTMGYLGNLFAVLPGYRGFDAVIAHGDSLLLPLSGRPVLRVMHGSAREEARAATSMGRRLLQSGVYLQELLTARMMRTVGVSENTRAHNRHVRDVIPNGVDLSQFRYVPRDRAHEPTILFVGAMAGRKRGQWMLDQFTARIRPRVPGARLVMVSAPGPDQPGVLYRHGPDDGELAALYRAAWVFASPSTYEGFGLPYLEAMASGVPVVATPNPGSREVLADGRYGRLVPDQTFADTVCDLLTDERAREALRTAGLARAREYELENTVAAYERLLLEMVPAHEG